MNLNTEILKEVLQEQIAKPAKAIVNPEAAFVKDKLLAKGEQLLAKAYWAWVCLRLDQDYNPGFGAEIVALQRQLNEIDQTSRRGLTINSRLD